MSWFYNAGFWGSLRLLADDPFSDQTGVPGEPKAHATLDWVAFDSTAVPGDSRHLACRKVSFVSVNCHRFVCDCFVGLESVLRPVPNHRNHSWLVRWVNCQWCGSGYRVPPPGRQSGIAKCCHGFMDGTGISPCSTVPFRRNSSDHDPGMDVRDRHPRANHFRADACPGSPGLERAFPLPGVPRRIDGCWDSSHASGVFPGKRPSSALDVPRCRRARHVGHLDDSPFSGLRLLSSRPAHLAGHVPLDRRRDHRGPQRGCGVVLPRGDADEMGQRGHGAAPDLRPPPRRDQHWLADT